MNLKYTRMISSFNFYKISATILLFIYAGMFIQSLEASVTIRPDGFLDVNGKVFLPIGLWAVPTNIDDLSLKEISEAGFNLVSPDTPKPLDVNSTITFMNKMQSYGLKVFLSPGDDNRDMDLYNPYNDRNNKKNRIMNKVSQLKRHPALLVWMGTDEPNAWGGTDEGLLAGYNFLKTLDTGHPIWINHAPLHQSTELLSLYNKAADITGVDIYPIPVGVGHSHYENQDISCVGDYTERMKQSVKNGKPVWMVLQAYWWRHVSNGRFPTYSALRFMAYDALVHGAKGITFFYFNYRSTYDRGPDIPFTNQFWSDLRQVVKEISVYSPAFTGTHYNDSSISNRTGRKGITWVSKKYNGKSYITVINETRKSADVRLSFKQPMYEITKKRTLTAGNSIDIIEPMGVRMYISMDK